VERKNSNPNFRIFIVNLIPLSEGEHARHGKEMVRIHVMKLMVVNRRNVLNHDSGLSQKKR
jgi:hypothetical protein